MKRLLNHRSGWVFHWFRWPYWLACGVLLGLGCPEPARAQLPFFLRVARQPDDLVPVSGAVGSAKRAVAVSKEGASFDPQPPGGAPWIVFSDRINNNTFRNANGTAPFKKMGFMDAFYVLKERNGYLKLIKYDPALPIGNKFSRRVIPDRKAVVYYGWAPKTRFLLANQSIRSADQRRAQVFSAVLAQPALLTNPERYFSNDSVRIFADPTQQTPAGVRMRLYELAYVYKLSETGRQALIGRTSWFPTDSVKPMVLGWVPLDVLQSIGQRLFIETDTVNAQSIPLYRSLTAAVRGRIDSTATTTPFPAVSWNQLGPKFPVVNQHSTKDSQTVVQTSGMTSLLIKKQVPVFNVNGQPIAAQLLTSIRARSNRYNLIYVIEGSAATQPYWGELINTIQFTITQLSQDTARSVLLRVGTVVYDAYKNSELNNTVFKGKGSITNSPLSTDYTQLLTRLRRANPLDDTRPESEPKSIRLGINAALEQFANYPNENNILILVGINGDVQSVENWTTLTADLKKTECRLLAFQVYASTSSISNDFVLQARELTLRMADAGSALKKRRLVRPDMVTTANEFNNRMGDRNVYQLDYPQRSMVPGWVLFPRKNQSLPFKELYAATDSLFQQVVHESGAVAGALENSFGRLEPLGDQVNPRLTAIYASAGLSLPTRVATLTRLDDYPYLTKAYTPERVRDGGRWKYIALLPADEYDGIGRWLDQLSGDDIDPAGYFDRTRLLHRYRQILREMGHSPEITLTLDQLLHSLLDLPVVNPLFKGITISQLTNRTLVSDSQLNQLLYLLRERRDYFRRIPTFRNSRFSSNGRTYYWISEDLFK